MYKNAHPQSIIIKCLSFNCLLHQPLYIFQFTCLKLLVNYCIKHWVLWVNLITVKFSELWFIFCLGQPKSKEHFPSHYIQSWRKFKDFSRLCEPCVCLMCNWCSVFWLNNRFPKTLYQPSIWISNSSTEERDIETNK